MELKVKARLVAGAAVAALVIASAAPASAGVIDWTVWTAATAGVTTGSASGTAGSVGVSYAGELETLFLGYPSWGPAGTFDGGTISNAPPSADGIIQLYGGLTSLNTITFSSAVTNPVMAIWSLGSGGTPASFVFSATPTFESGGPSNEYAGAPISVIGNVVSGNEGNGTIQFTGSYSSISWNNPLAENWYGFTVGVPETAPVPEPASLLLFGTGLIGGLRRWRKQRLNG